MLHANLSITSFKVGVCLTLLIAECSASAQSDPAAAAAIIELQNAYRTGEVCERVTLQVKSITPGNALPRTVRSSYVVRMELTPSLIDNRPIVAVDLGSMQFMVRDGLITAVHPRDPATFFNAPHNGFISTRAIAQALQPVPLPQLDLATAPSSELPCTEFWPYAKNITWTGVDVDPRQSTRKTIRGVCEGGLVTLAVSAQRLRTLTIDLADPKTVLTFGFAPSGPCDPQRAAIDVTRRQRVELASDLRPRAGVLKVGARIPELPLSPPGGGQWSLAEILEPPPEAIIVGMPAADHAVLLLTRPSNEDGFIPALPRLDLNKLGDLMRQMRSASFQPRPAGRLSGDVEPPTRFGFARVLVMNSPGPEEVIAQLRAAQPKWGTQMLWTTNAGATVDVFAPGADAAVVIVDAEGVLRSVLPIEPGITAEQVADQIQASLFELAPDQRRLPGQTIDTTRPDTTKSP